MELTGAEKSLWRGRGQTLDPSVVVGKGGVTPNLAKALESALAAHELVKVRLLRGDAGERRAVAAGMAEAAGACVVGITGRNALLYRPRPERAADGGAGR